MGKKGQTFDFIVAGVTHSIEWYLNGGEVIV